MSVYRTDNPNEFTKVDSVIITEKAPPGKIRGTGTGTCIMLGKFKRGPVEKIIEMGSQEEIERTFGPFSDLAPGHIAVANKKFSRLKIVRVNSTDAIKASLTAGGKIKFTAVFGGIAGNEISVKIENGTQNLSKKYTFKKNSDETAVEIDNIKVSTAQASDFSDADFVTVDVLATDANPQNMAKTNFTGGIESVYTDKHYEDALAVCESEGVGSIIFLDDYNAARNILLKNHVAKTADKVAVLGTEENTKLDKAIEEVANLRNPDGRLIYAFNHVKTYLQGKFHTVSPASFVASILSQTSPHVDPSSADNAKYLTGITDVVRTYSRSDFIRMSEAGILGCITTLT